MTLCLVCRVDRTVVVTARDFRGKVTSLCRACGGGEDGDDNKAVVGGGVKADAEQMKERK
jgi:hypothetical protein